MPSFSNDVHNFVSKHKYLSFGTIGIAVAAYAIGNLCGRTVKHLHKSDKTAEKTDQQFQKADKSITKKQGMFPTHLSFLKMVG